MSSFYEETDKYKKIRETRTILRPQPKPNVFHSKNARKRLVKRWKVVAWAVAFSKWLKTYSEKIVRLRQNMFDKFKKRNFNSEMMGIQKYIVKKCKSFFMYLINQKDIEFAIEDG